MTVTKKQKVNTLLKMAKNQNFVLASTLKQVGTTVKDISNKAEKGEFPGGQVTFTH